MDRRAIDAEIRELREGILRSPVCARIRKNRKDYSVEAFWRSGVSQVRFQKTLAAAYPGGDATVRAITVEKGPGGYQVRDTTTRDTFRRGAAGGAHAVLDEQVRKFESLEKALEEVEKRMDLPGG